MDDQRDEAPELDLSSHADEAGEDALQLTPSDSMVGVEFGEAFAVAEKPAGDAAAAPKKTSDSLKPSKSSERLGDQQFVAALLGQPMPVGKKKRPAAEKSEAAEMKPAIEPVVEAAIPETEPVEPAEAVAPVAELPTESTPPDLVAATAAEVGPQPSDPIAAAAETSVAEIPHIEKQIVEVTKPETTVETTVETTAEVPAEPTLEQTPWDAVQAPATPKTRPLPPAGPMAATAPITTIEPELLPAPSAERQEAAATLATPSTSESTVLTTTVPPASAMSAAPIAVLSGVIVATPAPPAETVAQAVATTPSAKSAVKRIIESKPEPMPAPVDQTALARDFAIPIPQKPKAAAAVQQPRPQPSERIAVKAPMPPADAMPAADLPPQRTGAWWTLPLMFAGLVIVACALIVPVADENHRAAYELAKIERDVAHFQQQADVNASFLSRVSSDSALAERLAMRQLNMIRPDEKLAPLGGHKEAFSMSPFALVNVDPPAPMPAYRPISGLLSRWFLDAKWQTYCVALGLLMTAAGVVLGGGGEPDREEESEISEPAVA